MSRRPWMPMYWGDYLRDTVELNATQHGIYLLLIAYYWDHGRLPPTRAAMVRVCKTTREAMAIAWPVISGFFTSDGKHKRIDKELEKYEIISTKRKLAGMRGASQRWQLPIANAMTTNRLINMANAPHTHNKNRNSSTLSQGKEHSLIINGKDVQPTPELVALVERQNRERGVKTSAREATALPTGAPRSPAETEQASSGQPSEETKTNGKGWDPNKPAHLWSKAEFAAFYAAKSKEQQSV